MNDLRPNTRVERIFLFRHGETEWSLAGRHTGLTDIPLTKNGRKEAKLLAKSLKKIQFDHVLCSPLIRAKETCAIAGFESIAYYDNDLVEWNYGEYEGKTTQEIRAIDPGWTIFSKDPPGGETAIEIGQRADRVIRKLLSLDKRVAVFSSAHFSRVLGARWMGLPVKSGQQLLSNTASKSILGFEYGYQTIIRWNDVSHLSRQAL